MTAAVGYHGDRRHYNDVIMTTMASQITSLTVVYSTVYSDADQRKHQTSASLAFVRGYPRTKGQLCVKMFPFDDVIMKRLIPKSHYVGKGGYTR